MDLRKAKSFVTCFFASISFLHLSSHQAIIQSVEKNHNQLVHMRFLYQNGIPKKKGKCVQCALNPHSTIIVDITPPFVGRCLSRFLHEKNDLLRDLSDAITRWGDLIDPPILG